MRIRPRLLALAVLVALAASAAGASVTAAGPAPGRLRAFDNCPAFLAYTQKQALPLVGAYGLGHRLGIDFVASPSAARGAVADSAKTSGIDFSGTNVQEDGVDEPDLVKTDGDTLFVASTGRLSAVDVRGRRPRTRGSLELARGSTHELLLHGNRLLVLSQAAPVPIPVDGARIRGPWPYPAKTTILEVDVADPARMRVVRTLELDGGYLTARLVGRAARIVLSSPLAQDLPFVQPVGPGQEAIARATEQNRDVVRAAGAGRWLPGYVVRSAAGRVTRQGRVVQCRNVRRPSSFAGLGLVTVLTVDVGRGLEPVDSDAVVSDGRVVYASRSSLYVATDPWSSRIGIGTAPADPSTVLHRFDIASPMQTHYRSSGAVPGVLLGQWALSERNGILRVASTELPVWFGGPRTESETSVTMLGERGGALVQVGRVGGLGKGERVYAVRFIGDTGYVVTFRQVDPLYTLDLSSPARPAVRGELKIRGYSSYLHPVGDDLLLGIGQDATDEGRVLGAQASLFDVSDLRAPRRVDAFDLGKGWSEAEHDHHAFLWWARTGTAVLPVQSHEQAFSGALALRVRRGGISLAGRVGHPEASTTAQVRRSVVVGDVLYTVSDAGVKASELRSFADLGFVRLGG